MTFETDFFESVRDLAGLSVVHSDFVVVTADRSGRSLYEPLTTLLRRVRSIAGVEVLFVTQFLGDAPVVRQRGPGAPDPDASEADYATLLLARGGSAAPSRCIAAPVVAEDGREFGTVCCHPGSRPARPDTDLPGILRSTARILALALARGVAPAPDRGAEAHAQAA